MRGTLRQFFMFLLVGVLNTGFSYALYSLFVFLGLHYSIAALVASALGALFNFRTTGRIVFGSRDNKLLVRFLLVYAGIYVLNVCSLKGLIALGLSAYAAGALLTLPMALVSYVAQRRLVFAVPTKVEHAPV